MGAVVADFAWRWSGDYAVGNEPYLDAGAEGTTGMGVVVRSEAEIREALDTMSNGAHMDKWYAAWAEALEWVLS